jgi:hypothetical protein
MLASSVSRYENTHLYPNLTAAGPNNDEEHPPQYCPPTKQCHARRLLMIKNICDESQGFYEPSICAPGFYCPRNTTQQLQCPKDHYCPAGSERPSPCRGMRACARGSRKQLPVTGLVILILVDVALLCFVLYPYIYKLFGLFRRNVLRTAKLDPGTAPSECAQKHEVAEDSEELFNNLEDFVKSSKRGIGLDATRMQIEFHGLGLTLSGSKKELLKGVTGYAGPGSLLAVMGASGAGKSTFVKVLMGKAKATEGSISINGSQGNISEYVSKVLI